MKTIALCTIAGLITFTGVVVAKETATQIPLPKVDYVVEIKSDLGDDTKLVTQWKHKDGKFKRINENRGRILVRLTTLYDTKSATQTTNGKVTPIGVDDFFLVGYKYLTIRSKTEQTIAGVPCTRYESTVDVDSVLRDLNQKVPDGKSPANALETYNKLKSGGTISYCVTADGIPLSSGMLGETKWQATKVERRPISEAEMVPEMVQRATKIDKG